jgi:predicted ATPase
MHEVFALAQRTMQHYEGTLTQYLGDGFVALFGAPLTHEDHARRAVLAALELQQCLCAYRSAAAWPEGVSLAAGIGLHTGPIVVGPLASEGQRLYTAVGETTSLASRLQNLAAPGAVVISEATYRLVCDEVQSETCGTIEVAETTAPVAVYRVQGMTRRLSQFVGRTQELAVLHEHLAYTTQGQGQVVGIVGEPGMGKSRLLYEFAQSLSGRKVTYYEGPCLAYGSATPYLPVRDLVRQSCRITETDATEVVTAKVRQYVWEAGVTSDEELLLLLQLLDVPVDAERLAQLSSQARRTHTFALLRQVFLHDCRRQPLVLAVENVHWIDATSEEWLTTLVERLPGAAILLLVTHRPGYHPPWLKQSVVTQIALPRLLPHDSLTVVRSVAQTCLLPDHLTQAIVAKADGNPFFLEELTWEVIKDGAPRAILPIPDTIQAVLAARLDRLPPEEKRLLQAAAVIGIDVPIPLLHAVTEMAEEEFTHSLQHLQAAEFLYETRLFPELTYTFKHALTQEVAYQSLLARIRQQIHRQIAEVLTERFPEVVTTQPELLAHHYTEADLCLHAASYWHKAGLKANDRSAHTEAIRHLRKGLDVLATVPDSPDCARQELRLQNVLGRSLQAAKGYAAPEVEHVYARARELCQQVGDALESCSVLGGHYSFYIVRAELQTARELAEHFLHLAQHLPDSVRGVGHMLLGHVLFHFGEFGAARTHLEQGVTLCDSHYPAICLLTGGQDPKMFCLSYMAWALWLLGYPD